MLRLRIPIAFLAALAVAALGAVSLAFGSEKLAEKEQLSCGTCHDKPGSKLLTDQGKYYETMRTLAGYEEVKASFGQCTSCHAKKPGSTRLTRQGQQFQDLVRDMEGLRKWTAEHHPTAPPAAAPTQENE